MIRAYLGQERKQMAETIITIKCSYCWIKEGIEGYKFNTITSDYGIINFKVEQKLICKSCGLKYRIKTILKTLLFGWWSRNGIAYTPFTIVSDIVKMARVKANSKEIIDDFITTNTINLRKANNDLNLIFQIVENYNKKYKDFFD